MDDVKSKVKEYICSFGLIEKDDKVLCALSGGADSAALVFLLKGMERELSFKICAAHLNHGIRGEEADRDEAYCVELCKRLDIPLAVCRANIPEEAKKAKMSVEAYARERRYAFLRESAEKLGCNKICTAHHADDNIETVLLHMIRGCGLSGITGIQPKRGDIIRPLLGVRKEELVAYLDENGIEYVFDSTNASDDYTRNYIRHNVLPHIYKINAGADKVFSRMCASLTEDSEFMIGLASEIPANATLDELRGLENAVLKRYIL